MKKFKDFKLGVTELEYLAAFLKNFIILSEFIPFTNCKYELVKTYWIYSDMVQWPKKRIVSN